MSGSHDAELRSEVLHNTLAEISAAHGDGSNTVENCCVICLDSISEPCEAQPCKHQNFDFLCLLRWLDEGPACPLCKAGIDEVRYDFSENSKKWQSYIVPQEKEQRPVLPATQGLRDDFVFPHRFQSRRQQHNPPRRHSPTPTPDEALLRRRHVYRNNLYSLHVGSNRVSSYRTLMPQLFQSNPHLVSRARMWLRRELQVFEFLSANADGPDDAHRRRRRISNAEFLLEYIIAILKTVDTQGSEGQAETMLSEFLGRENARLFLHELRAWLRSPYETLGAWDRHVQYDERRPSPPTPPTEQWGRLETQRSRPVFRGDSYRPRYSSRHEPYGSRRRQDHESRAKPAPRFSPD